MAGTDAEGQTEDRPLRAYLGAILRRERETKFGSGRQELKDFARSLRVDARTVQRFEAGETASSLENYVFAYAYLLRDGEVQDPRDWWNEAVEAWRHGPRPDVVAYLLSDESEKPRLDLAFADVFRRQVEESRELERLRSARDDPAGETGRSAARRASR